jgi:hypothetical protein
VYQETGRPPFRPPEQLARLLFPHQFDRSAARTLLAPAPGRLAGPGRVRLRRGRRPSRRRRVGNPVILCAGSASSPSLSTKDGALGPGSRWGCAESMAASQSPSISLRGRARLRNPQPVPRSHRPPRSRPRRHHSRRHRGRTGRTPLTTYEDLRGDHFARRNDAEARGRYLVRQLQALGHEATTAPAAA